MGKHLAAPRPTHAVRGMKNSGLGREGGLEALRFFTEAQNVCVKL
ncbi:hypothetical protein [Hymenobacter sp. 5516J-16]|nr:hypothetical protein [Hymenobacter sp. 5516J-16]